MPVTTCHWWKFGCETTRKSIHFKITHGIASRFVFILSSNLTTHGSNSVKDKSIDFLWETRYRKQTIVHQNYFRQTDASYNYYCCSECRLISVPMQIRNVPVIDSNQSKRPSTILMRKTKQRCRRRKFLPGDENLKASAKISIFSGSISAFSDSVWTEQQRQK